MTHREKIDWCIQQHEKTNHYYDNYLPYSFHLRMVVQVFEDFKHLLHLLPNNLFVDSYEVYRGIWEDTDRTFEVVELGCYGHDIIEDTRTTYNDCLNSLKVGNYLRTEVAEIIRAVTNYGRGRDRNERMPDFVYDDIRNTPGAVFVKLCDRIANVQYGKLTKSSMHKKYKNENPHFLQMLGVDVEDHQLKPMVDYLNDLFKD